MGEPLTNDQILDLTKDLFCYGEEDEDLELRMDFSRSLKPGSVILDFGTSYGRMAFSMAIANPGIKVFTFDHGRKELDAEGYRSIISGRKNKLGTANLDFEICEASDFKTIEHATGLNMDIEGEYEDIRAAVENCFPRVNQWGTIFVQSYYRETPIHVGIKRAVDEYVAEHNEYILGNKHFNTLIIHKE